MTQIVGKVLRIEVRLLYKNLIFKFSQKNYDTPKRVTQNFYFFRQKKFRNYFVDEMNGRKCKELKRI